MVTEVDELVGNVIDELDRTGQRDNTLIIYTSDHGEMLGEHGLWLKNTLLENAARVPLIFSGPGMPKGKSISTPVSHVDMVATMMEIGGAATTGLRGHALGPMARGESSSHPGFAYSESHSEGNCTGSFMIRKGDWKYLYFTGGEALLFNMKDDPGELRQSDRSTPSTRRREAGATCAPDLSARSGQRHRPWRSRSRSGVGRHGEVGSVNRVSRRSLWVGWARRKPAR